MNFTYFKLLKTLILWTLLHVLTTNLTSIFLSFIFLYGIKASPVVVDGIDTNQKKIFFSLLSSSMVVKASMLLVVAKDFSKILPISLWPYATFSAKILFLFHYFILCVSSSDHFGGHYSSFGDFFSRLLLFSVMFQWHRASISLLFQPLPCLCCPTF